MFMVGAHILIIPEPRLPVPMQGVDNPAKTPRGGPFSTYSLQVRARGPSTTKTIPHLMGPKQNLIVAQTNSLRAIM